MADTITTPARKPMSPAQSQYLTNLLAKIASEPVRAALQADLNSLYLARLLDTREASRQIDRLRAIVAAQVEVAVPAPVVAAPVVPAPYVAPVRPAYPVVAAGRYAVVLDGVLRFYLVSKNDAGTRTFVKRYKSDDLVKVSPGEAVRALRLIEADPVEAAFTYASELTRCMCCGRMLTDPESVALGIGPDCASKGR